MVRKSFPVITVFLLALFVLLVLLALPVSAGALTIEQINAKPPEFLVYLYDDEISGVNITSVTAHYDDQPMEVVSLAPASESGVDVQYIYALDISASINKALFDATKKTVLEAYDNLTSTETMILITFGDTVETLLFGGEDRANVIAILDSLVPNNMNTDFNGAIKRMLEISKQYEDSRKIGIIFSDGVDDTYAGFTRNELYNELRAGGISLNAMCVRGVASNAVSDFGELARLSGGELFLYDSTDVSAVLHGELLARAAGCYVLTLKSANNITDGKSHAISFKLGYLPMETIEVSPASWIEDESAPKILSVTYDNTALSLTVTFSEPVTGAANAGSYLLQDYTNKPIKLVSVSYSESNANPTATLLLEETPYEGAYTLVCSGIADVSMEKNALDGTTVPITLETGKKEFPTWAYFLIGGGALLVIVLIVLLVVMRGKKTKAQTDERIKNLEIKPVIIGGGEVGNQAIIPKATGVKVQMDIFDGRGKKYSVTQDIVTSLFIGKHSANDLVIEDNRISRQHAVIETLEKTIAIHDLNSTNGTFINGARIQPQVSQRVAAGDEITLGDTTIRIISIG